MVNKEQLLYFFLSGKISLSQYDLNFMANLQNMIHRDKQVTSNQVKLFNALVYKYKRQLRKQGFDSETLDNLSWRSKIIESSPEFTSARVDRTNNCLNLRVPFNKNFIKEMKKERFEWVKEEKLYRAPFSIIALKELYKILPKFFKSVTYAPDLFNIINEIEKHDKYIWEPTLIECGDRYVIACTNQYVQEATNHIDLSKLDLNTAFELSQYGVKLHPALYKDDKALKFASEFNTEVDIKDLDLVFGWLKQMNVTDIRAIFPRDPSSIHTIRTSIYKELKELAEKYDITIDENTIPKDAKSVFITDSLHGVKKQKFFQNPEFNFKKIIKVNDSRPPIIK